MRSLAEWIAHIAVLLLPFLPDTSTKILKRLELPEKWVIHHAQDFGKPFLKSGIPVERGDALFPRLDEKEPVKN